MQHFSTAVSLGISEAFLALMQERGIVWPFHKVELHAENAGDNLSHCLPFID